MEQVLGKVKMVVLNLKVGFGSVCEACSLLLEIAETFEYFCIVNFANAV